MPPLLQLALGALAALNLVTFGVYGWDKRQARRGGRRVPERRLLGLLLCGGFVGGWAGMLFWRHKTRKASFLGPAAAATLPWALFGLYLLNAR